MKRPLLIVALLYAGGVLLADLLPWKIPLSLLFLCAFASGLLSMLLARAREFLLAALLVLTGFVNLRVTTALLAPEDLRNLFREESAIVTVRGELRETPYH